MNPPHSESIAGIIRYRAKRILRLLLPKPGPAVPQSPQSHPLKLKLYPEETDPAIAKACILRAVLRCWLIKLQTDYRVKCLLFGREVIR